MARLCLTSPSGARGVGREKYGRVRAFRASGLLITYIILESLGRSGRQVVFPAMCCKHSLAAQTRKAPALVWFWKQGESSRC